MVAQVTTYTVRAERHAPWWLLTVPEVPGVVSQVRSLAQAEEYAREAVAFVLDVSPDSFDLELVPEVGHGLSLAARKAREATRDATQAQERAAAQTRDVARRLKAEGLTGRDVAKVLGVSEQRASQLIRG